jgi:hypothetical protein
MVCSKCRDVTDFYKQYCLQANECVVIEGSIVVTVKGSELNKNGSSRRPSITADFEWLVKEAGSARQFFCASRTEVTKVTTLVGFAFVCICHEFPRCVVSGQRRRGKCCP